MATPAYLLPANEEARVEALRSFSVVAAFGEPLFQELADLAAHVFNLPISFISVVETAQVNFVTTHGIPELSTLPRERALCSLPVRHGTTTVLNELLAADSSIHQQTAAALGLDFYVGAPLLLVNNLAVGALCISGNVPRKFSEQEQQVLEQLAALISRVIVVRHDYLQQQEGEQRWLNVQRVATEEVRALEALIRYIARRYEVLVPTPFAVLRAVGRRLEDVEEILAGK